MYRLSCYGTEGRPLGHLEAVAGGGEGATKCLRAQLGSSLVSNLNLHPHPVHALVAGISLFPGATCLLLLGAGQWHLKVPNRHGAPWAQIDGSQLDNYW